MFMYVYCYKRGTLFNCFCKIQIIEKLSSDLEGKFLHACSGLFWLELSA